MAASGKWIEGLDAQTPIDKASRRSLEPRLTIVAQCLPLAAHLAEHDIEHVHRLRVATRRATAAVKLYRDCLPDRSARWMKKRLKKIRRAAGDARDLDVLAVRLAEEYGDRVRPLVELIGTERTAVQPAILKIAERCRREDSFIRKTSKLHDGIHPPKDAGDSDESNVFGKWASEQLGNLADEFLSAMPGESSDVAALHQFRIRAKALRYAIELVAPAFGPELREDLYPMVEELQERLGRLQDHVTAKQRFEKWAETNKDDRCGTLLRELAEAEAGRVTLEKEEFHNWWCEDRVGRVRSVLASATSQVPATAQH
jgi:CHAD domain-containing protein